MIPITPELIQKLLKPFIKEEASRICAEAIHDYDTYGASQQ